MRHTYHQPTLGAAVLIALSASLPLSFGIAINTQSLLLTTLNPMGHNTVIVQPSHGTQHPVASDYPGTGVAQSSIAGTATTIHGSQQSTESGTTSPHTPSQPQGHTSSWNCGTQCTVSPTTKSGIPLPSRGTTDVPHDGTTSNIPTTTKPNPVSIHTGSGVPGTIPKPPSIASSSSNSSPVHSIGSGTGIPETQVPAAITNEQGVTTTTTGQSGMPVASPVTTDPLSGMGELQPSIPESSVLPRVSSISSDIDTFIPILHSWQKDPTSLKGSTLDSVDKVESSIQGFIRDLGGKSGGGGGGSECSSKKKRGLFDGVANIFSTAIDAFQCIDDVVEKIADNIKSDNIGPVSNLIEDLTGRNAAFTSNSNDNTNDDEDDDNDEGDDEGDDDDEGDQSSTSSSTTTDTTSTTSTATSTQTTSTCTDTTALQVTVRCKPTYSTVGNSVSTSTTCTPSTTRTVTGCSATSTTTTVTNRPACQPRTTATTSSACTPTTAPHVTVVCRPSHSRHGEEPTCSPSTTRTETGCSVTPLTTTITKAPACTPRPHSSMTEQTTLTTTEQVPPSTTVGSPSGTASESSTTQSTGPTATVNHDILPAFPTIIPKQPGENLCFRTINEDGRYGNFSEAAAGTLVGQLCADGDAFHPDDSEHVQSAPGKDGDLKVWIRWAEDQRGCSPKRAFPMGEPCAGTWLVFEVDCDISTTDPDGSYGGGFVSNSKFGCLEFGMVKDSKQ